MRHLLVIILLILLIDFFWKRQTFPVSYAVIRFLLVGKWFLSLFILPFNWESIISFSTRATGPYFGVYWILLIGSLLLPALLLHKKMGRNKWVLLFVTFTSTLGLTFEIYVIFITSTHQDYLSTSSQSYANYLFLRPLIMTSFLVGIELLLQKFRKEKADSLKFDIIDNEVLDSK